MGTAMELNNTLCFCDYTDLDFASDLTDTDSDVGGYAFTRMAPEYTLPLNSKRTYGVFVGRARVVPERRKQSRSDEQLQNEKASILSGAWEYIKMLQRQLLELYDELNAESACSYDDDDDVSSCEDDLSRRAEENIVDSNFALEACHAECCEGLHPTVEVVQIEGGLKIHIDCEKRPRILADIMELLEFNGMNVEHVSIVYQGSQFVFDYVGSEEQPHLKGDGKVAADSKFVETRLKSLITDRKQASVE